MSTHTWLLFALTEAVMSLTPGPAVMLVLSQGLKRGARGALWSNLGILAGNGVYFVLSAAGLGAVLLASYDVFFAIKWLGAAYLVYMGIAALLSRPAPVPGMASSVAAVGQGRTFANGIVLQLANPKALVFFVALLPQFIDPHAAMSLPAQIAILAATSWAIEFTILFAYGTVAAKLSRFAERPLSALWTSRVSGLLLIGAGVGVASIRKE